MGFGDGTFLVRESSQENTFAISVLRNGRCRHFRITRRDGRYHTAANDHGSIQAVVNFHRKDDREFRVLLTQ